MGIKQTLTSEYRVEALYFHQKMGEEGEIPAIPRSWNSHEMWMVYSRAT